MLETEAKKQLGILIQNTIKKLDLSGKIDEETLKKLTCGDPLVSIEVYWEVANKQQENIFS